MTDKSVLVGRHSNEFNFPTDNAESITPSDLDVCTRAINLQLPDKKYGTVNTWLNSAASPETWNGKYKRTLTGSWENDPEGKDIRKGTTIAIQNISCMKGDGVGVTVPNMRELALSVLKEFPDRYAAYLNSFVSMLFGDKMVTFLEEWKGRIVDLQSDKEYLNSKAWGLYLTLVKGKRDLEKETSMNENLYQLIRQMRTAAPGGTAPLPSKERIKRDSDMTIPVHLDSLIGSKITSPCPYLSFDTCISDWKKTLDKLISYCKGYGTSERGARILLEFAQMQGRQYHNDVKIRNSKGNIQEDKFFMLIPTKQRKFVGTTPPTTAGILPRRMRFTMENINLSKERDLSKRGYCTAEYEKALTCTCRKAFPLSWCGYTDQDIPKTSEDFFVDKACSKFNFRWGFGHSEAVTHPLLTFPYYERRVPHATTPPILVLEPAADLIHLVQCREPGFKVDSIQYFHCDFDNVKRNYFKYRNTNYMFLTDGLQQFQTDTYLRPKISPVDKVCHNTVLSCFDLFYSPNPRRSDEDRRRNVARQHYPTYFDPSVTSKSAFDDMVDFGSSGTFSSMTVNRKMFGDTDKPYRLWPFQGEKEVEYPEQMLPEDCLDSSGKIDLHKFQREGVLTVQKDVVSKDAGLVLLHKLLSTTGPYLNMFIFGHEDRNNYKSTFLDEYNTTKGPIRKLASLAYIWKKGYMDIFNKVTPSIGPRSMANTYKEWTKFIPNLSAGLSPYLANLVPLEATYPCIIPGYMESQRFEKIRNLLGKDEIINMVYNRERTITGECKRCWDSSKSTMTYRGIEKLKTSFVKIVNDQKDPNTFLYNVFSHRNAISSTEKEHDFSLKRYLNDKDSISEDDIDMLMRNRTSTTTKSALMEHMNNVYRGTKLNRAIYNTRLDAVCATQTFWTKPFPLLTFFTYDEHATSSVDKTTAIKMRSKPFIGWKRFKKGSQAPDPDPINGHCVDYLKWFIDNEFDLPDQPRNLTLDRFGDSKSLSQEIPDKTVCHNLFTNDRNAINRCLRWRTDRIENFYFPTIEHEKRYINGFDNDPIMLKLKDVFKRIYEEDMKHTDEFKNARYNAAVEYVGPLAPRGFINIFLSAVPVFVDFLTHNYMRNMGETTNNVFRENQIKNSRFHNFINIISNGQYFDIIKENDNKYRGDDDIQDPKRDRNNAFHGLLQIIGEEDNTRPELLKNLIDFFQKGKYDSKILTSYIEIFKEQSRTFEDRHLIEFYAIFRYMLENSDVTSRDVLTGIETIVEERRVERETEDIRFISEVPRGRAENEEMPIRPLIESTREREAARETDGMISERRRIVRPILGYVPDPTTAGRLVPDPEYVPDVVNPGRIPTGRIPTGRILPIAMPVVEGIAPAPDLIPVVEGYEVPNPNPNPDPDPDPDPTKVEEEEKGKDKGKDNEKEKKKEEPIPPNSKPKPPPNSKPPIPPNSKPPKKATATINSGMVISGEPPDIYPPDPYRGVANSMNITTTGTGIVDQDPCFDRQPFYLANNSEDGALFFSMLHKAARAWNCRTFYNPADTPRPTDEDSGNLDDQHHWLTYLYDSFIYSDEKWKSDDENGGWDWKIRSDPVNAFPWTHLGKMSERTIKEEYSLLEPKTPATKEVLDAITRMRRLSLMWGDLKYNVCIKSQEKEELVDVWVPVPMSLHMEILKKVDLLEEGIPKNIYTTVCNGLSGIYTQSYHNDKLAPDLKKLQKLADPVRPFSRYGGTPVMKDFVSFKVNFFKDCGYCTEEDIYRRFNSTKRLRLVKAFKNEVGLLQDMFAKECVFCSPSASRRKATHFFASSFMAYARNHAIIALLSADDTGQLNLPLLRTNLFRQGIDSIRCENLPAFIGMAGSESAFVFGTLPCFASHIRDEMSSSSLSVGDDYVNPFMEATDVYRALVNIHRSKQLYLQLRNVNTNGSDTDYGFAQFYKMKVYIDYLHKMLLKMLSQHMPSSELPSQIMNSMNPRYLDFKSQHSLGTPTQYDVKHELSFDRNTGMTELEMKSHLESGLDAEGILALNFNNKVVPNLDASELVKTLNTDTSKALRKKEFEKMSKELAKMSVSFGNMLTTEIEPEYILNRESVPRIDMYPMEKSKDKSIVISKAVSMLKNIGSFDESSVRKALDLASVAENYKIADVDDVVQEIIKKSEHRK
jgi:hypothetical protein